MSGADKKLTPKQAVFVTEYLIDLNATQAAIRTGYAVGSADVTGARLLGNASVAAAIQAKMDRRALRTEITADYVLEGIKAVTERCIEDGEAFAPMAAFKGYELLGKHLKLFTEKHELTGKDGAAIQLEQVANEASTFSSRMLSLVAAGAADSGTGETVQ